MMRIEATEEQAKFAQDFIKQGSIGKRHDFNGKPLQALFGIMAQTVICDKLGLPRPKHEAGFDGGYDLTYAGQRWDVKTELRNVDFKPGQFVHNVSGYQMQYPCDGFIFVSYNQEKAVFEICGFILKKHFVEKAQFYPEGSKRERSDGSFMIVNGHAGMWELKNRYLHGFEKFIKPC